MPEGLQSRGGVKDVTDLNAQPVSATNTRIDEAMRCFRLPALSFLISLGLLVMIVLVECVSALTATSKPVHRRAMKPVQKYSRFSHSSPSEHAALTGSSNCASCHRRNDGSLEPRFPVHKDCTGCHLVQFTASISSSQENPICTVCHSTNDLNASNSSTKKFPGLRSFTAEFDHAQHMQGIESARPVGGCATCHAPSRQGVAKTIPSRLNAHQTCYQCHSPGKQAGKHSSCGSCHRPGLYSPTSIAARAYRMSFSHRDHDQRGRMSCESCHKIRARGLPRSRQVSSIFSAQHFPNARAQSCLTCHNAQRTFGDADTHDCKRCHKGESFSMGN